MPTDASSSASAPNAVISTTGKRRATNPSPMTWRMVETLYIGSVGSNDAIARLTLLVSDKGSPAARTTKASPEGDWRMDRYMIGSGSNRVASLRALPTMPTTVIHGSVGSGGPMWIRAPNALPFGQYFFAMASLMMMAGGAFSPSAVENTRPCLSGIESV